MYRSLNRVPRCCAASWLMVVALVSGAGPVAAQSGEAVVLLPGGDSSSAIRTGEPLQISILETSSLGMTLVASVDRAAVEAIGGDEPRSYAALVAVPPVPLEALEVLEVGYVPRGTSTPVTRPWDGATSATAKSQLVSLEDLGWMRSQRIARLVVNPWVIEPAADGTPKLLSITAVIRFSQAVTPPGGAATVESASFEQVFAGGLNGPENSGMYRGTPPIPDAEPRAILPDPSVEHVVLHVAERGMVAVTGLDLRRAGIDLAAIHPDRLRLFHLGRELPIRVTGGTAGCDESTTVLFYAPGVPPEQRAFSPYDVFALSWTQVAGERMAARPARLGDDARDGGSFTVSRHIESDLVEESGTWYWCRLSAEKGAPDSRFVVIPDAQSLVPGETMEIRLALRGMTDVPTSPVDHHVRVIVNNRWTRDLTWDGAIPYLMIDELPSDVLFVGDNVVEIQLPGDLEVFADQVLLDWLELRYPTWGENRPTFEFTAEAPAERGLFEYQVYRIRGQAVSVFDLTEPLHPVALEAPDVRREGLDSVVFQHDWVDDAPRRFAVVVDARMQRPLAISYHPGGVDLVSESNGADLLIVAHPDVLPGLAPLVEHRRAQGLRVTVVSTEDVFGAFGHGFATPEAIRDLVRHAFRHWQPPAPSFLLLVGDATSDPLDHLGYGTRNLVPAFNRTRGAYPSDVWFSLVTAGDDLPDLHVGRLAVSSAAEAATVVDKILGWERDRDGGSGRRNALLVSDDDPGGRFVTQSARVAERLRPFGFSIRELSITSLELGQELPLTDRIERTHEELFPELSAAVNRGVGLLEYFGHGGYRVWAHEQLLDARPGARQIEQLKNRGRLPVVLSFSCLTTAFDNPRYDTIAERLVNSKLGGAVAFFGSSGNTMNPRPWTVGDAMAALSARGTTPRIGTALTLARLEQVRRNGIRSTTPIDSDLLIGDPSMVLDFGLD